jgi:hypothetical protein
LFRVEKAYVFYEDKNVVVAADVWMNPFADVVQICPNPIAPLVGSKELLVMGTTKPGIHPMLVVKHRVRYSYPSDTPPKSVIVYSMGIDAPARMEVHTGRPPPPLREPGTDTSPDAGPDSDPASDPTPDPESAPTHGPVQVMGYSASFSFEEALQDALAQARAKLPSPPRNPDVAVSIEITKIFARAGGNIRPGIYVTASAR